MHHVSHQTRAIRMGTCQMWTSWEGAVMRNVQIDLVLISDVIALVVPQKSPDMGG